MIYIKYLQEEINLPEQPITQDGEYIDDLYNPIFELEDFGYDSTYIYAKVFGSISDFQTMNQENVNYWIIPNIPIAEITPYTDPKFGIPKSPNDILKLKVRTKIEQEVGDNEDLISDLSKRVTMLERLVIRLSNDLINNDPTKIPTITTMYTPLVQGYLQLLANYNNQANIADLEDPMELFLKLFDRSLTTTKIVKEDYFDKKEN